MHGPPVLLSSYAVRIVSCGVGVLSSWSPFLGCLWFFRTWLGLSGAPPDIRREFFYFWMHSSSWPLPRLGTLGFPCYVFQWLSFQERGWVVLCFRHGLCGEVSGRSLAPRFAGFTVPAQPKRDNRNGRLLYPVRAVRCSWYKISGTHLFRECNWASWWMRVSKLALFLLEGQNLSISTGSGVFCSMLCSSVGDFLALFLCSESFIDLSK